MTPRLLCGLAATALLTLVMGVAPAAADSILYLKDGNVWLTTPDGARQFQVTDRGGYHGASQADDGTIIAVNGERLHKLNRYGDIVADFATPVTDGAQSPGETGYDYFHGPFDPVITPDGGKVAYSYIWRHNAYDPVCDCVRFRGETGTAITHSDRLTAWSEFGGHLSGWQHPSWVDDDDLLRSEADIPLADNVVVNRIGPGLGDDQLTRWFREVGVNVANRKDAEVNRKQTKLALVGLKEHVGHPEENVDWHVRVYRAAGGFGAEPESCFRIFPDQPNTEPRSPSWSPEGDRLAWEETAGIKTLTVPDFPGACNVPADDTKLIVPGGTLPDWGPAGVPTARPGGGSGADTGKPGGATTPATTLPVRVSRASLRRGFKVVVTAPGPGTIRATAAKRRKKVASGARKVKHAGRTTVRLRFTSRGRRSVRRAGRLRLSLKVSFAQPGQRVQRRNVKVTVTR